MISTKYHGNYLCEKKARVTRRIKNGAGNGLDIGSLVTITQVVRGHGFVIESETCQNCKQFCCISHVCRSDLELVEDEPTQKSVSKNACGSWISSSERLPKEKDADDWGNVLSWRLGHCMIIKWSDVRFENAVYWTSLPTPPEGRKDEK